jgi:ABC-type sugar transport system permease subunit
MLNQLMPGVVFGFEDSPVDESEESPPVHEVVGFESPILILILNQKFAARTSLDFLMFFLVRCKSSFGPMMRKSNLLSPWFSVAEELLAMQDMAILLLPKGISWLKNWEQEDPTMNVFCFWRIFPFPSYYLLLTARISLQH